MVTKIGIFAKNYTHNYNTKEIEGSSYYIQCKIYPYITGSTLALCGK